MKKKNLFILLITTILCVSFLTSSAWAGSRQRYRWEGVAIGIGAAILGNAIFSRPVQRRSCIRPVYYRPVPRRPVVCPSGYWEMRRTWVPPPYERIWVENYYNRYGDLVPGYWKERRRPGYWVKRRIWVADNRW